MNNIVLNNFSTHFLVSYYFFCILQNKILHDRLEALHIQLAERDRSGGNIGGTDSSLQNVVNYLRRTKEIVITFPHYSSLPFARHFTVFPSSTNIFSLPSQMHTEHKPCCYIVLLTLQAETEISLLKQEKLRLQSQVELLETST